MQCQACIHGRPPLRRWELRGRDVVALDEIKQTLDQLIVHCSGREIHVGREIHEKLNEIVARVSDGNASSTVLRAFSA